MSLDEITHACELPKPTTFRILNLLHGSNLLRRDPVTRRFAVGSRLNALALDLWRQSTLRQEWHKALQDVVAVIGESCNLTLLEGDKVLYLDRVETDRPLRLHIELGTRVPLHCSASGKLFLCQLPEAQVRRLVGPEPFERFTSKTITTYAALFKELAKVRATMVGTHDSELFEDSVAIAVPLIDSMNQIYAAVAVHVPSSRGSIKSCLQHLPVLKQAAATIGATMTAPARRNELVRTEEEPSSAVAPSARRTAGTHSSDSSQVD
jgi:DNA-binding IclR family transcriptional regulator